jgi:hypothetical protein
MAVLTAQRTTGGLVPAYAAAAPAGDAFNNTGAQTLLIRNQGPNAITATVVAVNPCAQGFLHPVPYVVPAGMTMVLPTFSIQYYNDANANVSVTYSTTVMVPPAAPVLAVGAAGLPNGTYRCQVTFVNAYGETSGGAEAVVTVVNQQISWSAIPLGPSGTTARKLYRVLLAAADAAVVTEAASVAEGAAAGAVAPAEPGVITEAALITQIGAVGTLRLVTTIADNTTSTYTDNVADSALGVGIPLVNTASVVQVAVTTA